MDTLSVFYFPTIDNKKKKIRNHRHSLVGAGQVGQDVEKGVKEALEGTGRRVGGLGFKEVGRKGG